MGKKTKIEYCDSTINPVMGCTGCELFDRDIKKNHCYAYALCHRMAGQPGWPDDFQQPKIYHHRLPMAIKWPDLTGTDRPDKPWMNGAPRVIFVNDLGDGFCSKADPEQWLTPYLHDLAASPHTWLFLSKWPREMTEYFWGKYHNKGGVPSNFWLGTTVTSQNTVYRIARLVDIKAMAGTRNTNLWLSVEPLLGHTVLPEHALRAISWIAAGGESGPNARPSHPNWCRLIRDDCKRHNIPFFFKQWGEWGPSCNHGSHDQGVIGKATIIMRPYIMYRVNKKQAGRTLDGQVWSQVP